MMLYQIFTLEPTPAGIGPVPFNAGSEERKFMRRSAALAWLIDWCGDHGYKVEYSHDEVNGAYDGLFYKGHECNEFSIQRVE